MAEKSARQLMIDDLEKQLHQVEAQGEKHSLIAHPLYIEGRAFPKIWLPGYLSREMEAGNYDPDTRCGADIEAGIGNGYTWSCDRVEDHMGNHLALFIGEDHETKKDQILEIWSKPHRRRLGITSSDVLWVDGEQIPYVEIPDITSAYAGKHCGQVDGETFKNSDKQIRWTCTMPVGHRCSHVAGNRTVTLSVWQNQ